MLLRGSAPPRAGAARRGTRPGRRRQASAPPPGGARLRGPRRRSRGGARVASAQQRDRADHVLVALAVGEVGDRDERRRRRRGPVRAGDVRPEVDDARPGVRRSRGTARPCRRCSRARAARGRALRATLRPPAPAPWTSWPWTETTSGAERVGRGGRRRRPGPRSGRGRARSRKLRRMRRSAGASTGADHAPQRFVEPRPRRATGSASGRRSRSAVERRAGLADGRARQPHRRRADPRRRGGDRERGGDQHAHVERRRRATATACRCAQRRRADRVVDPRRSTRRRAGPSRPRRWVTSVCCASEAFTNGPVGEEQAAPRRPRRSRS